MIAVLLALTAGTGAYLCVTGRSASRRRTAAAGTTHTGTTHTGTAPAGAARAVPHQWMAQAGLADVALGEFLGVVAVLALAGGATGFLLFAAPAPALVAAAAAAVTPVGLYRNRRRARLETAGDEWPRLIEELRLRSTTLGRSVPQALFEVGERAPDELRPAFRAAQREWRISTDFGRTLDVLKARLADPTADVVCETLLIADELGGTDLGPRLAALAEDRLDDVTSRKDARSKQAGVRLARRFVLVVPVGMAAAGSFIGTGRHAYGTPMGQLLVLAGMALTALCWWWASRYLRLPDNDRVFAPVGAR